MKKIFNLTAILVIACTIGNAQSITSITETSAIQCNGQTTTLTVVTTATNAQLPFLWYNLYVNVAPSSQPPVWIIQNNAPISLTASTFQTQSVQPDEYMVELVDGSNNNTNNIISSSVISNMTIITPFILSSTPSTSTNVSCFGASDGSITTYLTGGQGPYTLNWTGPMTFSDNGVWFQSIATGLLPGTYTCTPVDANGCPFQGPTISVSITEPTALNADANTTSTAVDCNGASTGTATVNPTGGTQNYSYLWTPTGQTTSTAINLPAGPYTCQVTDQNNCMSVANVTVTEPPLPLTVSITLSDNNGFTISCLGGNDGTASANVSGGTIGTGYSYSWAAFPGGVSFANTATVTGLTAGDYSCTVTDANNCSATSVVNVTEPSSLVSALSSVTSNYNGEDISCNGGSDGAATASGIGGTPYSSGSPYTYIWEDAAAPGVTISTAATATGLSAGIYNCTVTDANNCSGNTTVTLVEPTAITMNPSSSIPVDCNGNFTGSATVNPTQGTPPYSFLWDDNVVSPQQTQTATQLNAGTYNCVITDNNNCSYSIPVSVIVDEPDPLTAVVSSMSNVSCTGGQDAWATLTVSGGNPGYTYLWSSGHTGPTATGLSETTTSGIPYTCTVSDQNGCVLTPTPSIAVAITEPASLPTLLLTPSMVSCNAGSDGVINAVGSGGTAPYTYVWEDANQAIIGTGSTITGLVAGVYTCTLTDATGLCIDVQSTTVLEPISALTITHTIVPISCTGAGDGGATVFPTGGMPPYVSYSWSGPDPSVASNTTSSISGVIAGLYNCVVTDNNGCAQTEVIDISNPPLLTITSITGVDPSCTSFSTGSATANATGGTGAYTYLWTPGGQTTPTAGALTAGTYSCTVTDANQCTATQSITLTDPTPISVTPLAANVSCHGGNDGSISLTINGGTQNPSGNPYLYQWNNGATTETNSSLVAGSYDCTITDANGCVATTGPITVTQPANPLGVTVTVLQDESCTGADDGSVQANVTGGTQNYNYSWNNTATSQIASGLSAGLYTVVVTDGLGCTETASGTVNAASAINVVSSFNSPSCNSTTIGTTNDGSANVSVTGGTGNYFYSWTDVSFNVISTTSSASSLVAGTYNCAITDGNGCAAGAQVVVTEPSPNITATFNVTNINCFGGTTGALTINANGGTPTLTYDWSTPGNPSFSTNATIQSLTAGTYTCNVSDATGCITPFTQTITESAVLSASLNTVQMSAQGANDGSISVINPTGGDGTYFYSWTGPSGPIANTTASINMLPWGTYTVTITDGLGCVLTLTDLIVDPLCGIVISDNVGVIDCNDPNVVETAVVWWENTGGVPPYTNDLVDNTIGSPTYGVTLSNSWTTNIFSSNQTAIPPLELAAGVYGLTVTDAAGCVQYMSITPVEPPIIQITNITTTDVLCTGGSTGTVSATAIGGTPPLTISYVPQNSPSTPVNPSALSVGTYYIVVTDANGCVEQQSFDINEPSTALSATATSTLVGCFPTNDGTATMHPTGGTPPYNFLWGLGQTTNQISSLSAGIYSCVVTDANGCPTTPLASTSVTVSNAPTLSLGITVTDPTCNGDNNGQITSSVLSGTLPISYNWQDLASPGINISTNPSVSGLSNGVYSLLAVDAYGCAFMNTAIPIISPAALTFGLSSTNPTLNGASDGSAACSPLPSGGTAPYTYQWLGPNFSATTSSISLLPSGTYTLIVTDALGCTATNVVNLVDPACNVTLTSSLTQPLCFGDVASLSWSSSGGFGTYVTTVIEVNTMITYSLSSANPGSVSLPAGDYYIQSQDNSGAGCLSNANNFTVVEPLPLAATFTTTDALCALGQGPNCTGTISITVAGGTPTYNTTITDISGTVMSPTTLCPGAYVFTVTDFNGCQTIPNTPILFNIASPTPIQIPSISATVVSCNGGSDAEAMATIIGGTPFQETGVDPYTYLWSPSGDVTNPTVPPLLGGVGLMAGVNTIAVTDSNGCIASSSVVVSEPAPLAIGFSETDPTCFGDIDGNILATPSGGTAPYYYLWGDGQTTQTAIGLGAGTHFCTVSDANGCTFTSSTTLSQPSEVLANLTYTDVTCNGFNDGTASILPTGCTTICNVTWWDPAITTTNVSGLIPATGVYWVTVMDPSTGCFDFQPFDIQEPDPLTVLATFVSPTCNSFAGVPGADGSITAVASGGNGPSYTYDFLNSTPTIIATNGSGIATGIQADVYTVEVYDGICPIASTSVTVTGPAPIDDFEVITNVSCFGASNGNDGSIEVTPTGENNDFTYLWSFTGSPNNTSSGGGYPYLGIGSYSVLISPTNGCDPQTFSYTVTEEAEIDLITSTVITHASCYNDADGSISLSPLGGVGPYTYLWSDLSVNSTASGLSAGTYDCMVTDNNGCIALTGPITITEPAQVTTGLQAFDISCNGLTDGYATVTPGGVSGSSFTVDWNGITSSAVYMPMMAGNWFVEVTNLLTGCTSGIESFFIFDPDPIIASINFTEPTCNTLDNGPSSDGTATVTASGGSPIANPVYHYEWEDAGVPGVVISTAATAIGLSAGTYNCKVYDTYNGVPNPSCFTIASVTITEPAQILPGFSITDVSCAGLANGSATATPTGGTPFPSGPSYQYLWSITGSTTSTSIGYSVSPTPNTYTLTITDANGCEAVHPVLISEPNPISISASETPATCPGDADGSATMSVSGGTPPYSYVWSNGGTAATITSLPAGLYDCQIIDDNGCPGTGIITVTEPTPIDPNLVVTNVSCTGAGDGEVSIIPSGGNGATYSVVWSISNLTIFTLTGLNPTPSAIATVTDALGCSHDTTFSITENTQILHTTSVVDPWCNGDANGSASVTVSGGTGAGTYTYSWEDDAFPGVVISTASMATGLVAGSYTCTFADANGCSDVVTIVVTDPPALNANLINTDITCFGANDGMLSVSPSGSTGPYTVSWSTGATGNSISGLSPFPAVYAVTVEDAIGCAMVHIPGIYITEPAVLGMTVVESNPVSCNGGFDGQAWVSSVTGGTAPFTYTWPGGITNNTSQYSPYLSAGTYTVDVTDDQGCTGIQSFTITEPLAINPNVSVSDFGGFNIDCNGNSTGTLGSNPIGGAGLLPGDYTYSWTGPTDPSTGIQYTSTNQNINSLSANTYTITVTDINNCTGTQYITLTEPPVINFSFATSDYNGYNISCCGLNDGDIMATLTGGAGGVDPASYSWTGTPSPSNSPYINNLYAGTYTLAAMDLNGCPYSESITLIEPACLSVTATSGTTTCNGSNDGVASASVGFNTGVAPYTYQWNDINNQTTATTANDLQGDVAGITYTVTVTDDNGCIQTANSTIFSPTAITTNASTTDISCFDANDGSLSGLSSFGGAGGPVYVYSVDGGVTYMPPLPSYNNLPPGPIDVYTQDINGCIDMTTFNIIEPAEILPNITELLAASCIGVNDGALISNTQGGTGPGTYTYSWEDIAVPGVSVSNLSTATTLFPGTYNIIVTDADACIGSQTYDLLPAFTLVANLSQTPVACTGGSTGSVDALLTGSGAGTGGPVMYTWEDAVGSNLQGPSTTSSLGGLVAGFYTCTILDNLGCSVEETIEVIENPTNLDVNVSSTDLACYNVHIGTADLTVTGGTGPYTYEWNTVPATMVFSSAISVSGLAAGDYQAIVTDAALCTQAITFTITQPDSLYATIISTNVSCFAEADGIININTYNGTQPYSYSWSGPSGYLASTGSISNLDIGTYTLTVTDYNECIFTDVVTITEPPLLVGVSEVVSPSCHNGSDGSIMLTVLGGALPYYATYGNIGPTYIGTTGDVINSDTLIFDQLYSGNQPLNLTDGNGCSLAVTVAPLLNPLQLLIASTIVNDPICYADSGDISVNGIGGVLPYSYDFSDGTGLVLTSTTSTTSLLAGNYNLTLTDANGCVASENNIIVTEPNEMSIISDVENVDCFASNTGSISVTVLDAVGSPSYTWINDNTVVGLTETATNLPAGTYVVHVYDDNGCYQSDSYTIIENNEIIVDYFITDAMCSNSADGSIDIYSISGGVGLYDIYVDNVLFASNTANANISSLLADTFVVEVSDNLGCLNTMTLVVGITGSSDCVTSSIIVTPEGSYGTNDYWSPGLDLASDNIEVTILNRWGQEVWNCVSLSGGNDCRWTGENNQGSSLPSTDYYYIIEYTSETKPAETGVITLIR